MASRIPTTSNDFLLPDLGEGLEEAELVEWCVHVGDRVQENDLLAKMETAKALVDVPSPRGGTIAALHGKPGQAIKVGAPLVTYKDETTGPTAAPETRRRPPAAASQEPEEDGNGHRDDAGTVVGNLSAAAPEPQGKVLAAPAVRRLARDLGVDLGHVIGSGIGGRITSRDVERAAEAAPARPLEAGAETGTQLVSAGPLRRPAEVSSIRIPFRGVRKTIADHLRYSVTHAVHYTVMDEVDVSDLDALRRRLSASANEKISLLPFVAFAVCRVLTLDGGRKFGRLNSTVDDDTQEIVQHKAVHLGIATDTDSGLMVPVIRHAERMGVLEISREIARLAKAARERTVTPDKLSGSTFTLSNFGSLAGRFGTPIINYPEAGILGIGRAREGVVVHDGMLGVGKLLPLSLSADHRVIDGATAAGALGKIMELLQTPEELMPEPEKT